MKIIYIKETEETCDIVKIIVIKIRKVLNIIKTKYCDDKRIYYLPIFRNTKISKYRIQKLVNKINKLLEKDGASKVALSEYLENNQLLKKYLYSKNINILNARFLFKCMIYKMLEYIFRITSKEMKDR